MAFVEARIAGRFSFKREHARSDARVQPECIVLGVRDGVRPSPLPAARIFLGTESAQYRAERVFFWSIEQVRDPSRVYEIYLMKDLAGFDRRRWLTGFTNYRFAIPYFAGGNGRAIYNDVDQIYLADPAKLFDTAMGEHGFLSINDRDTSVMLIDCARMAPIWSVDAAQHGRRKALEAEARSVEGCFGPLDPAWNSRDAEYAPGRSKLVHYTTIHAQPWRPFPGRFAYQANPVGEVWSDLERSAQTAGYEIYSAARPSTEFRTLIAQLRKGGFDDVDKPPRAEYEGLDALMAETRASSVLAYTLDANGASVAALGGTGRTVSHRRLGSPASPDISQQFDAVVCCDVLDYLPNEDVSWAIEQLFSSAQAFVYASVVGAKRSRHLADGSRIANRPRDRAWWFEQFECAGRRHPDLLWRLEVQRGGASSNLPAYARRGGRREGTLPAVWVLADDKAGHTTQSVGLAKALGWPYEVKELRFTPLNLLSTHLRGASRFGLDIHESTALAAPWPELVISTGRRTAPVARWVGEQSRGHTRVVQLGRKGGNVADNFDLVVSCSHFRMPSHPKRLETVLPVTQVTADRLAEATERWRGLFNDAPPPRVALLVGGSSALHRLDAPTARRMAEDVRAFAEAVDGSVHAITSPRTGSEVSDALRIALGRSHHLHIWRPGEAANPYLGYLALADVLVVTGESESMLAEAAASGKPTYIYPLPEQPLGQKARLKEWTFERAHTPRIKKKKGTVRPQQGIEYLCARLIERGFVQPQRDLSLLHRSLVDQGIARIFGEPLDTTARSPSSDEMQDVARRVRALFGYT